MGLIGNLPAIDANNSYRENITDAYFKIESLVINTGSTKVRVQVRGWLSEYARHNQGIGIFKRVFYVPLTEFAEVLCEPAAMVTAAYEYIKTLPEFENATDSLEEYTGNIDITEEVAEQQEQELADLINSLRY